MSITPDLAEPIKVTVTDPATGEVLGDQVITDDYVLVCAGRTQLTHTQASANGTHVLTIKGVSPDRDIRP